MSLGVGLSPGSGCSEVWGFPSRLCMDGLGSPSSLVPLASLFSAVCSSGQERKALGPPLLVAQELSLCLSVLYSLQVRGWPLKFCFLPINVSSHSWINAFLRGITCLHRTKAKAMAGTLDSPKWLGNRDQEAAGKSQTLGPTLSRLHFKILILRVPSPKIWDISVDFCFIATSNLKIE